MSVGIFCTCIGKCWLIEIMAQAENKGYIPVGQFCHCHRVAIMLRVMQWSSLTCIFCSTFPLKLPLFVTAKKKAICRQQYTVLLISSMIQHNTALHNTPRKHFLEKKRCCKHFGLLCFSDIKISVCFQRDK